MAAEQAPVWSHIEQRSDSALLIAGLGLGAGDWNWLLLRFWFRVRSSDGPERLSDNIIKSCNCAYHCSYYREQTGSVNQSRMIHCLCDFCRVVS